MVDFKFTKPNGVASVGTVKKVPLSLANIYTRLGLGIVKIEDKPKKNKKK